MEGLSFWVGVLGNILSVFIFLSPVVTFWRIVKNRSTENFESLPYICVWLNAALWIYYGITRPNGLLIITVNTFGIVTETIFVLLFLIFAPAKMKAKTEILVGILDVGFVAIVATRLATHGDLRIDVVGFITASQNIVMYASPLAATGEPSLPLVGSGKHQPNPLEMLTWPLPWKDHTTTISVRDGLLSKNLI